MIPRRLSVREVAELSSPSHTARLVHRELSVRFARRIAQIESLPAWKSSEGLREVHHLYSEGFQDLRHVYFEGAWEDEVDAIDLRQFSAAIKNTKQQMRGVVPRLATSVRGLQRSQGLSEQDVNGWLDRFLISRMGTEMLSTQFLESNNLTVKVRKSIIREDMDPQKICMKAAQKAAKMCKQHFNLPHAPPIIVQSFKSLMFPYVPQYLYYIMVELLKNSTRATVEATKDRSELASKPIVVTIGADRADPDGLAIRLADEGGGIPSAVADRVWSYTFTTAGGQEDRPAAGTAPLAGFGVGLPLSRLYARHLGGSLHLQSMPGFGTNAYVYLKRIE